MFDLVSLVTLAMAASLARGAALAGNSEEALLPCDSIPITNSSELHVHTCTMPAAPASDVDSIPATLQPRSVPVQCFNSITAPSTDDASRLCAGIPDTLTQPEAPNSGTCYCNVIVLGSAAFAVCNCDYCNSITATGMKDNCSQMNRQCVLGGIGGLVAYGPPNGYMMLYRDGTSHFIPIGGSCVL